MTKRILDNYRDLFDDETLDILVRDVLMEHYEMFVKYGADANIKEHLLKAIRYFSTVQEYEEFLEEFVDVTKER